MSTMVVNIVRIGERPKVNPRLPLRDFFIPDGIFSWVYSGFMGVLQTQRPLAELQANIAQTKLRLVEMEKKLEPLIAAHRAQIAKSLQSKNETERKMAESISAWWEVPREPPPGGGPRAS